MINELFCIMWEVAIVAVYTYSVSSSFAELVTGFVVGCRSAPCRSLHPQQGRAEHFNSSDEVKFYKSKFESIPFFRNENGNTGCAQLKIDCHRSLRASKLILDLKTLQTS